MDIFVIAEIGINHNGDLGIAKDLIDVAKLAGANSVKFQKRNINLVYSKEELETPRESPWGKTTRQQKQGLEFNENDYDQISHYCASKGIDWFASAWDLESVKFLRKYDLKYNKVASAMITYKELLKEIASEKKYTFISTGMSTLADIDIAVKIFENAECPYELMHCMSTYPMNDEDANLSCINTLRDRYKCKVGYSGHEVGLAVSYAAVALKATSIERHITLDRAMYGSDQASSVDPANFIQLVGGIRKLEKAMGNGIIKVHKKEVPIAKKLRSHLPWESNT
tara:strand:+ start:1694 stop:2542 length:849 start_codon:yes stop_codon:yes gene_type:complete